MGNERTPQARFECPRRPGTLATNAARPANDAEAAQREGIGGKGCAHQTVEQLGQQLRQLEQKWAGLANPGF
jgi:hypothetical protein